MSFRCKCNIVIRRQKPSNFTVILEFHYMDYIVYLLAISKKGALYMVCKISYQSHAKFVR